SWDRHGMQSGAAGARSIPFVRGPVGAAERAPRGLIQSLAWREVAGEIAREVGPHLLNADPLMRKTLQRVDVAVAASPETVHWMEKRGIDVILAPSVGYDPAQISPWEGDPEQDFVSVGRLLGWKGFHLGIRAFSRLAGSDATYRIIGE